MTDRKEIIEKYSHFISSRYKWLGWISGLVWASGVFFNAWLDPVAPYSYVFSAMIALGLGFLWYLFNHRYKLLLHFNILNPDAFDQLEKYLLEKRERWDHTYIARLGFMLVLGLMMLLLLFFDKESKWTGMVTGMFIALILAFIIKGWLDFNDEILLHDIRRSMRDQMSE